MTPHPNCTETWMYDTSISEEEFWQRVFHQEGLGSHNNEDEPDFDYEDWSPHEIETMGLLPVVPCPECSQREACGYDEQGRPWIHLVKDHDEE